MKVRIYNNSIRLRLSKSEVAEFQSAGLIEERLEFGTEMLKMFRCALVREEAAEAVTARYLPGIIEIVVPPSVAARWSSSDQVAIEGSYTRGERPISISIEKDFQCLHGPADASADAFPNPAAAR
jgi:hypothetical protein